MVVSDACSMVFSSRSGTCRSHVPAGLRHSGDVPQREDVTVDDSDFLANRFEEHRGHLRAVAYRMLGSLPEADDAVQEAWFRLMRAGEGGVENLGGWLT